MITRFILTGCVCACLALAHFCLTVQLCSQVANKSKNLLNKIVLFHHDRP